MRQNWVAAGLGSAVLPALLLAQGLDCAKLVPVQMPFLSEATGWGKPEYYTTIQTARITGQESLELMARGPQGILMWTWDAGHSLWIQGPAGPPLSDAAGWNSPAYYLTIRFGDVDGDGLDEMIARDAKGVHTWKYNQGSRIWAEAGAVLPINTDDCVDASCYSTFRMGMFTSSFADSLIYRDRNGLQMYSWNTAQSQWVSAGSIPAVSDENHFNLEGYYPTINLANILNEPGNAQIVYRDWDGLHAWDWNNGHPIEFGGPLDDLSDHNGFGTPSAYLTLQWVRIDGRDALVARKGDGLHLYRNVEGMGWVGNLISADFSDANGWTEPQFYRSIRAVNLDPSASRFQIMALTPNGLGIWSSNNPGTYEWERVNTYSAMSPATGWSLPQSYLTLQQGVVPHGQNLLIGRSPSNLVTLAYNPQSGFGSVAAPGFPTVSVAAYQWISQQLPLTNPNNDVRVHYINLGLLDQWPGFQTTVKGLKGATPPPGVSPADFESTRQQIENELGMIPTVVNWFSLSRTFIDEVYGDAPSLVTEVQLAVTLDSNSSANVAFNWISAILKILSSIASIAGQPQVAGIMGVESTVFSMSAAGPSGPGGLNPTVYQILQNLDQQRTNARDANACATNAFLQNWVLMQPLDQGVQNGTLAWNTVDRSGAEDAAEKGYKLWLYQTLTPPAWEILESCSLMYGCVISSGYPEEYIFDNGKASLYLTSNFRYVSPKTSSLDILFKAPPAGYGTPLGDVFYGQNGWNLNGTLTPNFTLNEARIRDVRQAVRRLMNQVRQSVADESIRASLMEPLEMVLKMLRESRRGGTPRSTALDMLQLFQLRLQLHSGPKLTATAASAHAESAYGISYLLTDYPSVEIHGVTHQQRPQVR